jgi:hypothetical protein
MDDLIPNYRHEVGASFGVDFGIARNGICHTFSSTILLYLLELDVIITIGHTDY